ncbi:MAG: cysteine hydrolase [Acidimicrobiales bacterium]|nr:cysteine hydrolase [Acidimicrobiales bacterium]
MRRAARLGHPPHDLAPMTTVAHTDPYPWPWDAALAGHRLALVIAGGQQHWAARSADPFPALAALATTAGAVRAAGGLVVAIRHTDPAPWAAGPPRSLPARGTAGWQLALPDGIVVDHLVDAAGADGFYGSPLDDVLRRAGRDQLALAGLASEVTVDSTLRSANDRGYECLVLTDACAPHAPALGARALHSVTMSGGIFGALGTTAALRAALDPPGASEPPAPPTRTATLEEHR